MKPGPVGSWEELFDRALVLRRMVKLLIHGYSYRGIARELGIARTTVMRMAPDVAKFSGFTNTLDDVNKLATYDGPVEPTSTSTTQPSTT